MLVEPVHSAGLKQIQVHAGENEVAYKMERNFGAFQEVQGAW